MVRESERVKKDRSVFVCNRTALHWAAKRNHQQVVEYLLTNGADRNIQAHNTFTPARVCTDDALRAVLESRSNSAPETVRLESLSNSSLPIVPNYLRNPVFPYVSTISTPAPSVSDDQTVTLLCRIADDPLESDFVEFDFCKTPTHGSYQRLLHVLCEEFNLDHIDKIRRLPHVRMRHDRDVERLKENHMLEIVQMKSEVTLSSPSSTDT